MTVFKTSTQHKKSAVEGGGLLRLFFRLSYNHFLRVQNEICTYWVYLMEHIFFEVQLCIEISIFRRKCNLGYTDHPEIEVRDFPARDIWSLGVILPGLDQIPRVLGTSPPPPPPPPSPPSVGPKWSKYEQKWYFMKMDTSQNPRICYFPEIKAPAGAYHRRSPFQNLP